jgi:hypothetical protein
LLTTIEFNHDADGYPLHSYLWGSSLSEAGYPARNKSDPTVRFVLVATNLPSVRVSRDLLLPPRDLEDQTRAIQRRREHVEAGAEREGQEIELDHKGIEELSAAILSWTLPGAVPLSDYDQICVRLRLRGIHPPDISSEPGDFRVCLTPSTHTHDLQKFYAEQDEFDTHWQARDLPSNYVDALAFAWRSAVFLNESPGAPDPDYFRTVMSLEEIRGWVIPGPNW